MHDGSPLTMMFLFASFTGAATPPRNSIPSKNLASDWLTLEQALVYAPSSFGLQPWKFFVVTDQLAARELLKAASRNQGRSPTPRTWSSSR